jgi:histidine triad (HIT) family protein
MGECPFCEILASDVNRDLVASWEEAVAFEPLGPIVPGHLLVVPRRHVIDALEDPALTAAVMRRVAEFAERPCNIITSAGAGATQTVFHLHVHIVPRQFGDGLKLPWTEQMAASATPTEEKCHECNGRGHTWEFSRDGYVTCDWCGGSGEEPKAAAGSATPTGHEVIDRYYVAGSATPARRITGEPPGWEGTRALHERHVAGSATPTDYDDNGWETLRHDIGDDDG